MKNIYRLNKNLLLVISLLIFSSAALQEKNNEKQLNAKQLEILDKWAKYKNCLIPLAPFGFTDFSNSNNKNIKLPKELGDYAKTSNYYPDNNGDVSVTYATFLKIHFCTNYVSDMQVSSDGKLFKYLTGAYQINSYKSVVFIAKINQEENDIEKKVEWLKTFGYESGTGDGQTNAYGTAICATRDGGCVATAINRVPAHNNVNMIIRLDKTGNVIWKKNWQSKTYPSNTFPQAIIEDKDQNVVICMSGNEQNFVATNTFLLLKLNGNNGNVLLEKMKRFEANSYALYGGFIEVPNQGYMLVINFSYLYINGNKIQSKSSNHNSPWNIAVLKFDYMGNTLNIFPFLSDEPKYVNTCEYTKEKTIRCTGRRGNYDVSWGMNHYLRDNLQFSYPDGVNKSFFIEIDTNGNIIQTNGIK